MIGLLRAGRGWRARGTTAASAGSPGPAPAPARTGLALVTANFGGIDTLKRLPGARAHDAYYYTDAPTAAAADAAAAASWTRVLVPDYPRHDFSPRLRGRYFKHQIHRLPEVQGHGWLAWADASVRIDDPLFLAHAVERLATRPPHERVMLIPHPYRRTVRHEYESIAWEIAHGNEAMRLRYADEKMPEQMAFFAAQGWDLDAPLWCGTLWLVENSPLMNRAWDAWWDQNLRYGLMDQLSLPVCLAAHGIVPQAAPFGLIDNPHFQWCNHVKLC